VSSSEEVRAFRAAVSSSVVAAAEVVEGTKCGRDLRNLW
jgi:hypothetical protein